MGLKLLHKKKSFKIFLISGILIILGVFVIFNHSQILKWWEVNFEGVKAGTSDNVRGWAWGENMGWISMNCYNDFDYDYIFENCCPGGDIADCTSVAICQGGGTGSNNGETCSTDDDCLLGGVCSGLAGGDYGVYYDTSSQRLSGYAWSDKVGWICFGETCGAATTPHGWPFTWACVGRPTWTCDGGDNNNRSCSNDAFCLPGGGTCEFSCSGDGGEDFLDISIPNTPCYSTNRATLKAHWEMNAPGGIIANALVDASIYGNTLSGSNLPTLANGKIDDALQFDGYNDYIQASDSDSLSVMGNLTVEAWIKRGIIGSEQTIIGKWDETELIGERKSYRLWFDINNKLNFSVADANDDEATITQTQGICFGGSNEGTLCSNDSICEGVGAFCRNPLITDTTKWHHIAGKYIASSNAPSLRLFIDGARVNVEYPETTPVSLSDKDNKLYIGAKMGSLGMDTYFNGIIDNIAIWSCGSAGLLSGRSGKDIWADAKMEVSGWAKVVALGDGGWLKLQGFTKAGKVWGLHLDDYADDDGTFYTIGGYMANRHADTSMDTEGLVANWLMDEASWTDSDDEPILVADSSPLANNPGTAYGAVPNTEGIFNSAGEFDGVDDYIDCGSGDSLEVPTTTIQAWIKRNSIDVRDVIVSDNITSALGKDHFLRFEINSDDQLAIIFGDGTIDVNKYSVGTINDTSWHHIAVVRDDTDKTITFHIDGEAESAQSYTGLTTITTLGINNLLIGKSNITGSNVFFHGLIDNVSIYNMARTGAQILADYNKKDPYCVGWDDYDHEYGDPPAPFDFEITEINNTHGCEQLIVYWDSSNWAESYTYWRKQVDITCPACSDDATCDSNSYDEYNVLDGDECQLPNISLTPNTGYCYAVVAHNETDSTYNSNGAQWWKTTLCAPEDMEIDDDTCGEIAVSWTFSADSDGYNIYNSLSNENFGIISHLGEAMDYTGLMAQWKMNETSWDGTNKEVRDSSNQTPANHGTTAQNSSLTTTDSGKFSYAGDFDGSDDYITVPSKSGIEITDAITVEAWIKPTTGTMSYDARVVSKGHTSFEDPYAMYELNLNLGKPRFRISVSDVANEADSDDSITFDQWHHLAGTYDGIDVKIYVDGTLKDTIIAIGSIDTNNQQLAIGRHLQSAESFFDGLIDNVAIYNVAKTAEQIKIDYEADNLSNVCHIEGVADDNCDKIQADPSICCYTDKRILPYVNYYYKTTATSEAGESPDSDCDWGVLPDEHTCPAGVTPPCCPWGNTICFPPVETEEE